MEAAISTASSKLSHSSRSNPPTASFVSVNGPSVTAVLPSRTRTVRARRGGASWSPIFQMPPCLQVVDPREWLLLVRRIGGVRLRLGVHSLGVPAHQQQVLHGRSFRSVSSNDERGRRGSTFTSRRLDGEQCSRLRQAFEDAEPSVRELDPRARDEVAHRAGRRAPHRPASAATRAPVCTAIPRELAVHDLAFAGVQAAPGRARRRARRDASAQRIARAGPSKLAKNPSPAVSISRPRNRANSSAHGAVVKLQELSPAAVSERRRALGRADEVGEENRGQDPLWLDRLARPREEFLDLVEDHLVDGVELRSVILAR